MRRASAMLEVQPKAGPPLFTQSGSLSSRAAARHAAMCAMVDLAAGRWELVTDLSQAVTIDDASSSRAEIVAKAVGTGQIDDSAVDARTIAPKAVGSAHAATSLGVVPVGAEVDFAGVAPPSNLLWSNGALLNRFSFIPLFEALSHVATCNTAVGSTTITNTAVPLGGIGLIGTSVEGPGIPFGTALGFASDNAAVLSNPAPSTGSGVAIRIMPHGTGDGVNTFHLPDRRGRMIAGRDDMGGATAGRLSSIAADRLASVGGSEGRTLTPANLSEILPGGSVTVTYPSTTYVTYSNLDVVQPGTGKDVTNLWRNAQNARPPTPDPRTFNFGLANPGGGQPFNVLPPVGIANKIIFTGV